MSAKQVWAVLQNCAGVQSESVMHRRPAFVALSRQCYRCHVEVVRMRAVGLAVLMLVLGCAPDMPVAPVDFVHADIDSAVDAAVSLGTDAQSDAADVVADAQPDVPADPCAGKNCDDGSICTQDNCVGGTCVHIGVLGPCEDGNTCTVGDACVDGVCLPGAVSDCADGTVCTDDSSDLASGCTHTANSGSCDDGTACTIGDTCQGGSCVGAGLLGVNLYEPGTQTADGQHNMAQGVVRTLAGGYAIAGSVFALDMWLIVTDAFGKKLWDRTYSDLAGANAIAAMADGGYALAGWKTISYQGFEGWQVWTVRTDASGNTLWSKSWLTTFGGEAQGVVATSDGGVIIVAGIQDPDGTWDAALVRYGADGSELWSKTYSAAGDDFGAALVQSPDGGFAFSGTTSSKGAGGQDMWLVRVAADGAVQWQATYGGPGDDWSRGLVTVPESLGGGFAVVGATGAKGSDNSDCWVVRVDAAGKELWDAKFGGPKNDACDSVAVLADGGFAMTGTRDAPPSSTHADGQFWLLRLDAMGALIWHDVLPGLPSRGNAVLGDSATGHLAAVGAVSTGMNTTDALFLRTDAFGHTTCAESGVCLPLALTACDDANPCTADLCDAVHAGCWHTNLPDETTCGTDSICAAGVCTLPPPGMVLIPAGTFWMGCNSAKDSDCISNENPQHKVVLSAYYMDLTETTVGQYEACVDAGVCTVPSSVQPAWDAAYPGLTDNPVNYVTWTQSQAYCKWRGAGFDLPTEAQWEMAARGSCEKNGSTANDPNCAKAMRTYPWGEAPATCSYAVMYDGSTSGCGTNATWAVGSTPAGDSPYGLHDMAGHVWEWNRDWYGLYSSGAVTDPGGPGSASYRVYRGGSLDYDAVVLRAGLRGTGGPSAAWYNIGLRCMRSYP